LTSIFDSNSEERNMNRESATSVVVGLVVGMAFGSVMAFMLAPQDGRKTRNLIKEKFGDVGGLIKETTGDRKKIYTEAWNQPKIKPYSEDYS
jgi:gas vesicle protein